MRDARRESDFASYIDEAEGLGLSREGGNWRAQSQQGNKWGRLG